eukprot:CAMPEP_0176285850 /NCGR_PEP_ID=MMETSP0121_2-20121125/52592_1 /TAXON_ID=160619 /ORGANISM="Kryptoperidinium foliaceum, Strain CCMP 1326" /LENGTH=100 /DNA_ID=CAMNT_0017626367 /DNA_START=330 /DNA_END=627 /DNA_ORIENTATION=+
MVSSVSATMADPIPTSSASSQGWCFHWGRFQLFCMPLTKFQTSKNAVTAAAQRAVDEVWALQAPREDGVAGLLRAREPALPLAKRAASQRGAKPKQPARA